MNEEHTYKGSKTKNYFSAYLLASVQGRRKRYLEIQKKIQLAENNSDEQEYTEADLSMEEHLERKKREELLLNETQGIYPEWNEMEDKRLIQAMHLLNEKEREVMYQRVFEERDFKEIGELNQMTEDQCKWMYYGAIRKIRRKMGGEKVMEFRELLYRARMGDQESIMEIFEMYRPLLVRNALVDGFFDEDLYQELIVEFLRCIRFFRDVE